MQYGTMNCESCGGALVYAEDGKSAKCPFCGNVYHFKAEKSEALVLALNRANEYRLKNDFDGAITEYKLVTERNPEDSEAYWGLAISTYGIEYVEDPRTKKRIPTCRRTVQKSILEDENYLKALENATEEQKEIYERKAGIIDRLQRNIKRRLEEEEDYDVFISFKSTDEDGNPTKERGVARRIYDELEKRGIKTFFSEVTLRDRIGEDYEPIIYKALYSCKFFILVAASEENMNSAWVKNEWSRFRDRVFDENLTGAGCAVFEGISPSVLPAFLRGQGINLAKYPAGGYEIEIADALSAKFGLTHKNDEAEEIRRQIEEQKKAFEEQQRALEERLKNVAATTTPAAGASATVNSLLKRAKQESESGDYDAAQNYYNKVLDADPENAEAWLGLFYASNRVKDAEGIGDIAEGKLAEKVPVRKSTPSGKDRKENLNEQLKALKGTAEDCDRCASINKQYVGKMLGGKYFVNAEKYATANTREEVHLLREAFMALLNEKNAALAGQKKEIEGQIGEVAEEMRLIEEGLRRAAERKRKEEERKAAEERRQQEEWERRCRRRKRAKRIAIASCIGVVVLAVAGFFAVRSLIIIPNRYEQAKTALEQGDYEQAVSLFEKLGDYEDSKQLLKESYYGLAVGYELEEETYLAATTYGKAAGYEDAWEKSYSLWSNFVPRDTWGITSIYSGRGAYYAYYIQENGAIAYRSLTGSTSGTMDDFKNIDNIVSIKVSSFTTERDLNTIYVLTAEGKVFRRTINGVDELDWENIVQIEYYNSALYGLKADGTVITTKNGSGCSCAGGIDVSGWKDIRMFAIKSGPYIVGLKSDGSVLFSGFNGNNENNLAEGEYEAVFAVDGGVVARRADGTAALSGALQRNFDADACADLVCVSGDYGVRADGTGVFLSVTLLDEAYVVSGFDFVSVCQNSSGYGLTHGGDVYKMSIEGNPGKYYIGTEKVATLSGVRLPSYPWAD